ncbi:hypothetical protein DSM112329_02218 [Paraconexibacter sp. AEG42_29]|uniref:Polysaccharide biosynthesis protein n=1 Tax=Paraconexibacter sp. AEG42_29 TaxID=2997339 RepID=A0AAU7AV67_9ACTN
MAADSPARETTARPPAGPASKSYGSGAKILSIGIASTGLFTFAYFSVASHALDDDDALGGINLLWTILFITISVIYRPVEQLLSRSIATRRAQGHAGGHPLRDAARIQAGFALAFLVVAFAFKGRLIDAFDGEDALFWILIVAALAYAASYFARGYFAGHQWFALYGGLVFFESVARFCFPVAVAVGLTSGQTAVALGIAAAPLASLAVIPLAVRRYGPSSADGDGTPREPVDRAAGAAREGATFAGSVAVVQLAEQTLLNAGPLFAPRGAEFAVVFGAFLITRSPLQLFQSIQTSLLPHLAGLEATEGSAAFAKAIRTTVLAIAAFAGAVALGLLAVGPFAMDVLYPVEGTYSRWGLALIGVAMGLHLTAGTLNQAALARGQASLAAVAWAASAVVFVAWMAVGVIDEALLRAEVGYAGSCALLCAALVWVYRAGQPAARVAPLPDPPPLMD